MAGDQWLFRQADLILGPVPTNQLVDKLFAGELTGQSEVQQMGGGVFRAIKDVPELRVHLAKAEAKLRIDAAGAAHKANVKKRNLTILSAAAGVLVVVGAGVAIAGRYLAVHATVGSGDDDAFNITVDTPTFSKAQRSDGEELVDYQGGTKRPGGTAVAARPNPNPGTGTAGAQPKPKMGAADPDGLSMGEVDQDMINGVIAANKKSLFPCLRAAVKPGQALKVPIEFAIAETGKVTKLWIDNPDLKDTGLQDCMFTELQKWPFKPGPSGTSVKLSFNLGAK